MPDDLADYVLSMDDALRHKRRFVAYNKDIHHAHAVVCLAFRHADSNICLLSQKLDPELYASPWFLEEAQGFFHHGGRLRILVETDLDEHHPVHQLAERNPAALEMQRVPDDLKAKYRYNYMVVDDVGYRFERDRDEPRAVVVFHDEDKGARMVTALQRNFELLSSRACRTQQLLRVPD